MTEIASMTQQMQDPKLRTSILDTYHLNSVTMLSKNSLMILFDQIPNVRNGTVNVRTGHCVRTLLI